MLFHCDATQGIGYYNIDVRDLNIDILTFSSHKIYGPKGIGAIYINNHILENNLMKSQIEGGGQQRYIRSGTLNVPGIVAIGRASELIEINRKKDFEHTLNLRNYLYKTLFDETDCILMEILLNVYQII